MTRFKHKQISTGFSVGELADILSVSAQMVYYWREYGVRNWKTASKLARKLKCTPEDLLGYTYES